ncbi:acyltransferase [Neorhizobium sp. JUb45]|uniref:acyltransferase family protein n=1 Tax=unclassified Neorhizobium TaxID=2629175 RepID=UPI0010533356|nr:acyltransferase [Neorhizobium sp. JUb45]TCR06398.1 peptidoglycan/LPS O-acetylase OafA/YrhL [Neorhizobium sp. JUb45]
MASVPSSIVPGVQQIYGPAGGKAISVSGYVAGLDGLRGIAVISVILGHFGAPGFSVAGGYGVDVFFVLSGYLISKIIIGYAERGTPLSTFYWNRFARLVPPLVLVCACLFLLPSSWLSTWGAVLNTANALFYTANWTRAFPTPGWPNFMAHSWSLSVEEQFYLLWPPLLYYATRRHRQVLATLLVTTGSLLLLMFLIRIGASEGHLYNGAHSRSPALFMGCCLAVFPQVRLPSWMALAALLAYFGMVCLVSYTAVAGLVVSVLALILVCHARFRDNRDVLTRVLSNRILIYFGVISYGAYLWHFPIWYGLSAKAGLSPLVAGLWGIPATVLLAHLTYVAIEYPVMQNRERLAAVTRAQLGRILFATNWLAIACGLVLFYGGFIVHAPY